MKKRKKKKKWQKLYAYLNVYYPKTQLIKVLNSLDSFRPYGRLLEIPKTWGSMELFLPQKLALQ